MIEELSDQVEIPSPYYRVSIKAIILNAEQQMLVMQTSDGMWELPGGGWEHGESMQHCIRRELMEELGVGVSHIIFDNIYPYSALGRSGRMRLKLAVVVTLDSQDFKYGPDIKLAAYVTAKELAALDMIDSEVGIKTHIPRIWP